MHNLHFTRLQQGTRMLLRSQSLIVPADYDFVAAPKEIFDLPLQHYEHCRDFDE